ncbi:AraC family transcriptional regulator ligand-binding domain-containing protein [Kordia sp. YSTF-M3]|uniref:AraC family transcriptional regulator ligand-binding domain-containing protein n=1 Tax=Kordia aestuariivivens TaxID=2759037 RepID=A0ABR7Q5P5_9FLAO|nr:AraC family transcriptional regulator [Kordia aestuariivivens]MBC8753881.1 AraC family transcriptional regulator ligand-binding domain-containing protein [Kordia aestuariivivens]
MSLYRKMINHALSEGLHIDELNNLSTPVEAIPNLNAVPAEHFFELHELLDAKLGAGFSVRVGQEMKIDDYGVLGLAWKTCSWVGEIFDRSERYFKLLSDTYVFKVERNTDIFKIYLFRDAHRRGLELSNEATFSATVVVIQAIGDQKTYPVSVSFKHSAPKKLDDYQKAFQCPILFNQSHNVISYKTEQLEMRTTKADASINAFLVERVKEATEGIELNSNKIVTDIENLIKDALPSGIPSVAQLAEIMGMSARTLTRRLSKNNVTFRDLIQKKQEELSKYLLSKSHVSIAEIAFKTGFSEQSAFNRAFKRWTGKTPIEYRKF